MRGIEMGLEEEALVAAEFVDQPAEVFDGGLAGKEAGGVGGGGEAVEVAGGGGFGEHGADAAGQGLLEAAENLVRVIDAEKGGLEAAEMPPGGGAGEEEHEQGGPEAQEYFIRERGVGAMSRRQAGMGGCGHGGTFGRTRGVNQRVSARALRTSFGARATH